MTSSDVSDWATVDDLERLRKRPGRPSLDRLLCERVSEGRYPGVRATAVRTVALAPGRRARPGSRTAKSRLRPLRSSPCRCREAVGRLSVHVWGQSRRVSRERREDRGASGRERRWQRWYRAKTSSSSPSRKRARPAISAPVAVVCSERTWPRSVATIQLPRGCGTTRRQGDCIGPGPVLICVSASRVGVTTAVRAAAAREDQAKCCAYSLASKARAPLTSEQAIPPI